MKTKLIRKDNGNIVLQGSRAVIGQAVKGVDGYYYYVNDGNLGHMSEVCLIMLYELIRELNEPINKSLDEYFNEKD